MSIPGAVNINVASTGDLANRPTLGGGPGALFQGYDDGTQGFVGSTGLTYVLKISSETVDGVTILATRDDPDRQWVALDSSTAGVDSIVSPNDTITITNPGGPVVSVDVNPLEVVTSITGGDNIIVAGTSTGDVTLVGTSTGTAATPAMLALVPVALLKNASQWLVLAMRTGGGPATYTLQAAISATPDNFWVIPTFDDPSRQWVQQTVQEQGTVFYYSDEINLLNTQTIIVFPPMSYRYNQINGFGWCPTVKTNATVGPTVKVGTNASFDNMCAATVQAGLIGVAVDQNSAFNGISGLSTTNLDLTANGLKLVVTAGATATALRARIRFACGMARF